MKGLVNFTDFIKNTAGWLYHIVQLYITITSIKMEKSGYLADNVSLATSIKVLADSILIILAQ